MKINKLLLFCVISSITTSFISCSKDDNLPADPAGTIALNMMNEDNGTTELGHSDVYIDNANNFRSETFLLSSLGKKNGIKSISDMQFRGGTDKVAVEPGNAYQVFPKDAIRKFPSGKVALNISDYYYNTYVVSHIVRENTIIGANVKFALMNIPNEGLPNYDSFIGTLDHQDGNKFEIIINLPTSDFEYEETFGNVLNTFEIEKTGNQLAIRLIEYGGYSHILGIYIRVNDSYTYVHGQVL